MWDKEGRAVAVAVPGTHQVRHTLQVTEVW